MTKKKANIFNNMPVSRRIVLVMKMMCKFVIELQTVK